MNLSDIGNTRLPATFGQIEAIKSHYRDRDFVVCEDVGISLWQFRSGPLDIPPGDRRLDSYSTSIRFSVDFPGVGRRYVGGSIGSLNEIPSESFFAAADAGMKRAKHYPDEPANWSQMSFDEQADWQKRADEICEEGMRREAA